MDALFLTLNLQITVIFAKVMKQLYKFLLMYFSLLFLSEDIHKVSKTNRFNRTNIFSAFYT
jgi:hypothetical protein